MGAIATVTGTAMVPTMPGGAVVAATRDWLGSIEKRTTKRSYRTGLRNFVAWLGQQVVGEAFTLGDLPTNAGEIVSARTVKRYMRDLEHQGKARATINHRLSVVRKWIRALEDAELIHPHRAEAIYHVRGVKGQNKSHRSYLVEAEIQKLLDGIGMEKLIDLRDRALVALLYTTGMRRSELCGLCIGQYKRADGHTIIDAVARKGHDTDWVKVAVPVQRALEAWWTAASLVEASDPMFCAVDKGGRPSRQLLSANGVYHIITRRTKRAGFCDISPHAFRRSFATNADLAGAPTSVIQAGGGWKSRAMLDIYIQQRNNLDRNVVDYLQVAL